MIFSKARIIRIIESITRKMATGMFWVYLMSFMEDQCGSCVV